MCSGGPGSLGGGELGYSLGALRHSVLGQLAGQDEAHSGLNLARGHCGLLVVARQLGSLNGNLLKDVSDEGVEDGDSPGGDTSVGVDLRARDSELISTVHSGTKNCDWALGANSYPSICPEDYSPFQVLISTIEDFPNARQYPMQAFERRTLMRC